MLSSLYECNQNKILLRKGHDQHQSIPTQYPLVLRDIIQDCWNDIPDKRPSAKEISNRCAAALKELDSKSIILNRAPILEHTEKELETKKTGFKLTGFKGSQFYRSACLEGIMLSPEEAFPYHPYNVLGSSILGSGSFGAVYRILWKDKSYALKLLKKDKLNENQSNYSEAFYMHQLNSSYVIKIKGFLLYPSSNRFNQGIIMDLHRP